MGMHDTRDSKAPEENMEDEYRALVEAGDLQGATTAFMQRFGGDILAFLAMRLRDQTAVSEVYSEFTLDFWRGLEGFEWRTTLRGWGYTLARNAANRFLQRRRREKRLVHPDRTPDLAEERRPSTAPYLRTAMKKRMRELRERLPMEDQSLLVLRIDKGLSWNELAVVFSAEGATVGEAEVLRSAARLRQRFAAIKRRLRTMAEEEGLL